MNMTDEYKFGIVGVGPVGSIMGAHLANAGHEVTLVDILKDHLDEIKKTGLSITGYREMNASFSPENICYSIEELREKDVDIIFIAVKAALLKRILPLLADVVNPNTIFISLQNGLDTEEIIAETFGKENTLRIVVNYAGNLLENGKVRMSFFNPPNYIGMIDPSAEKNAKKLAKVITAADLETVFTRDIKKYEWEKIILNSALSPVCALTKRTMKQMMELPETRELVRLLLVEGIEIAAANNITYDDDFLDHCMAYLDNAGHHKTSMHVDMEAGRRTEIDFLNGKIVEYGNLAGLPTPYNSTIVALIKGSEISEHKE